MSSCAVIVCNGRISDYEYLSKLVNGADVVICADGGASHLRKINVLPDILLGDFDSVSHTNLEHYRSLGVKILEFPAKKDFTDTQLAVEYAIKGHFDSVILVGALGTRLDHSLANVFLLKKLRENGIDGILVDEHNEIMLIDSEFEIKRGSGLMPNLPEIERGKDKISLLPFSDKVQGLTTNGLCYPLDNVEITSGWTIGVSNEFCSDAANVSIKTGLLLIIRSRD